MLPILALQYHIVFEEVVRAVMSDADTIIGHEVSGEGGIGPRFGALLYLIQPPVCLI
jgi:hypothetical protein